MQKCKFEEYRHIWGTITQTTKIPEKCIIIRRLHTTWKAKENDTECLRRSLQCLQGKHYDEYTRKKENTVCLFRNGVYNIQFEIEDDKAKIGGIT